MNTFKYLSGVALIMSLASSCAILKPSTSIVGYQSVRTAQYKHDVPSDAVIKLAFGLSDSGTLAVVIENRTDKILTVDQTMSFFVNSDGKSISYYDPTIRNVSSTDTYSTSRGVSVNAGAVANALGVGGPILRSALLGVNIGGGNTNGNSTTVSTTVSDIPQIAIGPKGYAVLDKKYTVTHIGDFIDVNADYSPDDSYCRFSVCITYSFDDGVTYDKLITNFYVNSVRGFEVQKYNGYVHVNDALKKIYESKPDALTEQWWAVGIDSDSSYYDGVFVNWK